MNKYSISTLSLFFFILFSSNAQENTFEENVDFVGDPYPFEKLAFDIIEVRNELADPKLLGKINFGESKEEYKLIFEPELEQQFKKFFKQALRKSETGDIATTVVFKELSVNVNAEDTSTIEGMMSSDAVKRRVREYGVKNWKNRNYKIAVDYLIENSLVYSDSAEVDSFAHMSEYSIDQFCSVFFNQSLSRLNQKAIAVELYTDSILNEKNRREEEAKAAEEAAQAIYKGEKKELNVRLKYFNNGEMKVLPKYTPDEIREKLINDYRSKEYGFYRLKASYVENEDDLKILDLEQLKFSNWTQVRTRSIIAGVLIGFVSGYLTYQATDMPDGAGPSINP
jgi:hypothetical protein